MKSVKSYPSGLLQVRFAGMPLIAEYKGVKQSICSVCGREAKCHVFAAIADAENYPDYKQSALFFFGENHAKRYVEVVGKAEIIPV